MSRPGRAAAPLRLLLALHLLLLLTPAAAPAQCAMCRETAAFQKERAVGALKKGIAMLAVPPAGIAAGLAWAVWKRSRRFASD